MQQAVETKQTLGGAVGPSLANQFTVAKCITRKKIY